MPCRTIFCIVEFSVSVHIYQQHKFPYIYFQTLYLNQNQNFCSTPGFFFSHYSQAVHIRASKSFTILLLLANKASLYEHEQIYKNFQKFSLFSFDNFRVNKIIGRHQVALKIFTLYRKKT